MDVKKRGTGFRRRNKNLQRTLNKKSTILFEKKIIDYNFEKVLSNVPFTAFNCDQIPWVILKSDINIE